MTDISASDITPILNAVADPDTPANQVRFVKINGVTINWTINNPLSVTLSSGAVAKIWEYPAVNPPKLDVSGMTAFPTAGNELGAGSVTYTMTDGTTEVGPFNMEFPTHGIASTPPPVQITNTVPPAVSGTPSVGQLLSCTTGTWTGTGTITYAYQWYQNGAIIGGANASTYTVQSGDAGTNLRCVVTGNDANGTANADSNVVAIGTIALTNTHLPSFSGTPVQGQTLTAIAGTWVGQGAITLSYQWLRGGAAISGATGSTYVLQSADVGTMVTLKETATDSLTSGFAISGGVTVSAPGTINRATLTQIVMDEFASHPDKSWAGFPDETGFTVYTVTTPDQAKAKFDAWAAGTITGKVKVICDWTGILNASATRWTGVNASKLTANGAALYGYDIPSGGFWMVNAAGKRPIWGTQLWITGAPRLHIEGVHFAGARNGGNVNATWTLRIDRNPTFPINGTVYLANHTIGQMDNRPGATFTDYCDALLVQNGYSFRSYNVRTAGTRLSFQIHSLYRYRQYSDSQKGVGDIAHSWGYASAFSGRIAYVFDEFSLARDMEQQAGATGLHTDFDQLGTGADAHAGYMWVHRYFFGHMKSAAAFDSQSQGFYNDDSLGSIKFLGVSFEGVLAFGAYHGLVNYDPSKAGHFWAENMMLLRAGDTYQQVDTWQWYNGVSNGANGGTSHLENCTLTTLNGNLSILTTNNVRYVSPKKSVVSGTGLTQASPKRIEDWITGTVSRDGSDFMTYTIPGEADPDFATAWYALADFFKPKAGWGTVGVPTDPETWPGAPVRP